MNKYVVKALKYITVVPAVLDAVKAAKERKAAKTDLQRRLAEEKAFQAARAAYKATKDAR